MQIICTQADHKNHQIIGVCIDSTYPKQRPYCHFCLPSHVQHINKLASLEQLSGWIKERILTVQNVQECKIALESLINFFLPFNNLNFQELPKLGLQKIDQLIKNLCQMENCEEQLFKQLKQSIEQIKSIVNEILKKNRESEKIKVK